MPTENEGQLQRRIAEHQQRTAAEAVPEKSADNILGKVIDLPEEKLALALHSSDGQKAPQLPAKFDFAPNNLDEAMRLAEMMSKSSIVPKDYQNNPGNVLVAIQWGMELNMRPLQAMQNIAVINGRPTLWGDAVLALVRSAVDSAGNRVLEGISETFDETTNTAICEVKRRGAAQPCVRKFSLVDATKAGLIAKGGVWAAYPKRMLQMRARSWALRDEFTDVLRGMPVAEEVMDYIPPERDVTPLATEQPVEKKADRLKEKMKAADTGPALAEVMNKITAASNTEQLAEAADFARGLKRPEDQALASAAYKKAKARLTGEHSETLESGGQASAVAP